MKVRSILPSLWIVALNLGCVNVNQFAITQPLDAPLSRRPVVSVGEITTALPLDMQATKKPRPEELQKLQQVIAAELRNAGVGIASPIGGAVVPLEVQGTLLDFDRGNGLVRFFVGFGLGQATLTANLRLIDHSSGHTVFAGNFVGAVSGWTEGDEAFRRLAVSFATALTADIKRSRTL